LNEHEELQEDLPAYAAGRLEDAATERLEAHLRECEGCREMVDTLKEFASALREGGEALFEPHPAESTLKSYARGEVIAERGRIERHLEVCATCSLEAETWKRGGGAPSGTPLMAVGGGLHGWGLVALASAAGLVVGFGISELRKASPPPPPVPVAQGPAAGELQAGPLLILPRILRGDEAPVRYQIDAKRALVVIACPASIPDEAAPGASFRYELRNAGGQVVWSRDMTATAIREHLDGVAEEVTLLAPTSSLAPGRYVFSLSSADRPDEVLYRADLEIAGSP